MALDNILENELKRLRNKLARQTKLAEETKKLIAEANEELSKLSARKPTP